MIKPLNGRVLVEPDKAATTTASGIILPGSKEKPETGVVLVGGELVKKGQRVLFAKFGYDEAEIEGKTLYFIIETSLLGIFD